jgi:hypothetical protein
MCYAKTSSGHVTSAETVRDSPILSELRPFVLEPVGIATSAYCSTRYIPVRPRGYARQLMCLVQKRSRTS